MNDDCSISINLELLEWNHGARGVDRAAICTCNKIVKEFERLVSTKIDAINHLLDPVQLTFKSPTIFRWELLSHNSCHQTCSQGHNM